MSTIGQLRFDITDLVERAKRFTQRQVDGVSINLPFVSINVKPDDTERRIANEVVIRLADRRVLNASECCDNCIDQALRPFKASAKSSSTSRSRSTTRRTALSICYWK